MCGGDQPPAPRLQPLGQPLRWSDPGPRCDLPHYPDLHLPPPHPPLLPHLRPDLLRGSRQLGAHQEVQPQAGLRRGGGELDSWGSAQGSAQCPPPDLQCGSAAGEGGGEDRGGVPHLPGAADLVLGATGAGQTRPRLPPAHPRPLPGLALHSCLPSCVCVQVRIILI